MATILYIPLDERPVNLLFPQAILESQSHSPITLITPPASLLGAKKTPADRKGLWNWLEEHAPRAHGLLCSLDTLLYGGIVPSRLHHYSHEELIRELHRLGQLKEKWQGLTVFASNLIMRVPAYNSSDEEPHYYHDYGEKIFRWGWLQDKLSRKPEPKLQEELSEVIASIPNWIRDDYLQRREKNHMVNLEAIKLAASGIIDFLVIPLDDCAEYGFSASEQRTLLKEVEKNILHRRVHLYPGADEVGSTLLCRMYQAIKGYKPRVFVRYSSTTGEQMIPRYEDRPLGESIKSQITVCGGVLVDNSSDADLVLMVNSPTLNHGTMQEASAATVEKDTSYYSFRNLREFVENMAYHLQVGRKVALADVAFGNGADHELMGMLAQADLLGQLHSYAAWNTPGNSLGTVLAHSLIRLHDESPNAGLPCKFILDRYVEDWGYQVLVRKYLRDHCSELGITYFDLKDRQPQIQEVALGMLREFTDKYLRPFQGHYQIDSVYFPWNRLFEIGLHTTFTPYYPDSTKNSV